MRNSFEPLIPLNVCKITNIFVILQSFFCFFFTTCTILIICARFCTYFFTGSSIFAYSSGELSNFTASFTCLS